MYSFHDVQSTISEFRENRIQQFKLVYPKLTSKQRTPTIRQEAPTKRLTIVSTSCANPNMFKSMVGQTNADIIDEVCKKL